MVDHPDRLCDASQDRGDERFAAQYRIAAIGARCCHLTRACAARSPSRQAPIRTITARIRLYGNLRLTTRPALHSSRIVLMGEHYPTDVLTSRRALR